MYGALWVKTTYELLLINHKSAVPNIVWLLRTDNLHIITNAIINNLKSQKLVVFL